MSASLVRRSLELVDTDSVSSERKRGKKNKGVFDIIPAHHQVIKSVTATGKKENRKVFNIGDSSSRIHKNRKTTLSNRVEENLKKLEYLCSDSIKSEVASKLIKRAQTGKAVIEIPEEKPEEGTAFTEEDFLKFERENF